MYLFLFEEDLRYVLRMSQQADFCDGSQLQVLY